MKAGKPSNEMIARNISLLHDLKTGNYSTVELVKKYNITPQRIYAIKKQYQKKSEAILPIDNTISKV